MVLIVAAGCSGSNSPVNPVDSQPQDLTLSEPYRDVSEFGRSLLMACNFELDFETQEITIEPLRTTNMHFSIRSLLQNPAFCPGNNCLTAQFTQVGPTPGYFKIKVTLVNPSNITGRDVRGIVYNNTQNNHRILNADEYTKLWAPPNYNSVYPFKAFAKGDLERKFPPLASFSANYEFQFNPLPPKWVFFYAVDASWPSNCEEPYEITGQEQIGAFYASRGCSQFTVQASHHSGPAHLDGITLDATPIGGDVIEMDYDFLENTYSAMVINEQSIIPGDYDLLITARATGVDIYLYDYFHVTVVEDDQGGNVRGDLKDFDTDQGLPLAHVTTSDGTNLFEYDSDFCGYFATSGIPDGQRVLSITKPGYYSRHALTTVGVEDVILDESLHKNEGPIPPMPILEVDPPSINLVSGIAVITGHMHNMDGFEDLVGVYVHQGQEYLMDVNDATDAFQQAVILAYGTNEIVLRATNASGTVLSSKIIVDYFPAWNFRITLTWDTDETDIDLHVWEPDLSEHLSYVTDFTAHLELDYDDVQGFGPENVTPTTDILPVGVYPIAVNYYSGDDSGYDIPTTCFITLRLNPGTPEEQLVVFDYELTYSSNNTGYPINYNSTDWWRPCDVVVLDGGIITWQTADLSIALPN